MKDITVNYESKEQVLDFARKIATGQLDEVEFHHCAADDIVDIFDLEVIDFNGWECDWWAETIEFEGVGLDIRGTAWYASCTIGISEDEWVKRYPEKE